MIVRRTGVRAVSIEPVPGTEGIDLIDTEMFGQPGFTAAFLFRSDKTLLVDAGLYENGEDVHRALREVGVHKGDLDYLAVSHLHLDHAGGATYLAEQYPEAEVLGHSVTAEYLSDPEKLQRLFESGQEVMSAFSEAYGEADPVDRDRLTVLADGDLIDLGSRSVRVLHAPGHAPHQLCFYDSSNEALHLVDEGCALFEGKPYPTTPPPDFHLGRTLESLDRFLELAPEHLLYSHFGVHSNGSATLRRHREVLVDWVDLVRNYQEEGVEGEQIATEIVAGFQQDVPDHFEVILKRDVRGVLNYLEDEATP